MGIKTFFQPWLIQPTYPTFAGEVTDYDPLQDAYDLSVEAGSWAVDILDQLTYANELYAEAAETSKAQLVYQRDRRSAALGGIAHNKKVMGIVNGVVPEPEPVASELGGLVIENCYFDDKTELGLAIGPSSAGVPWYVPVVEPEPEPVAAPKRRRVRKVTEEAVEKVD